MVLFFIAIALWLLPMTTLALLDGAPAHRQYLHELLFRQTATRYANAWGHQQPWWYFAEVIATSWLPFALALPWLLGPWRSEEHTSELQSLMRISYAVFCLKKKNNHIHTSLYCAYLFCYYSVTHPH